MENITELDYKKVLIDDIFWSRRQAVNIKTTIWAIKEQYEKSYRFDALKCQRKRWQFFKPKPHFFWDSDVAKWLESAAYILAAAKNADLEAFADSLIDTIGEKRLKSGYFNSHFQVMRPKRTFTVRNDHELYCAGHLIEAAVAYFEATGKRKLLDICIKYADHIYDVFYVKNSAAFSICGHAEIELALIKLYICTKDEKYLVLSKCFVDRRGTEEGRRGLDYKNTLISYDSGRYGQDDIPLREQTTAEGHSVRAMYLYCAAADIALIFKDQALFNALDKIFDNIKDCKSYITGGLGSRHEIEGFGANYDLPNDTAYNESCAAIGMVLFAERMFKLKHDSKYTDMIERVLYNAFLSAIDLKGERFYYTNPLEFDIEARKGKKVWFPDLNRSKNFICSCCPPNISRLIGSMSGYIYMVDNDTLYVNQYIGSSTDFDGQSIKMKTSYPLSSQIEISLKGNKIKKLALRLPAWCDSFYVDKSVVKKENGYLFIDVAHEKDKEFSVSLTLDMDLKMNINNNIACNKGKTAISYGPLIYCGEGIDNGELKSIEVTNDADYQIEYNDYYCANTISLKAKKEGKDFDLKLIPYFAFNNRGESDMRVYWRYKEI